MICFLYSQKWPVFTCTPVQIYPGIRYYNRYGGNFELESFVKFLQQTLYLQIFSQFTRYFYKLTAARLHLTPKLPTYRIPHPSPDFLNGTNNLPDIQPRPSVPYQIDFRRCFLPAVRFLKSPKYLHRETVCFILAGILAQFHDLFPPFTFQNSKIMVRFPKNMVCKQRLDQRVYAAYLIILQVFPILYADSQRFGIFCFAVENFFTYGCIYRFFTSPHVRLTQ